MATVTSVAAFTITTRIYMLPGQHFINSSVRGDTQTVAERRSGRQGLFCTRKMLHKQKLHHFFFFLKNKRPGDRLPNKIRSSIDLWSKRPTCIQTIWTWCHSCPRAVRDGRAARTFGECRPRSVCARAGLPRDATRSSKRPAWSLFRPRPIGNVNTTVNDKHVWMPSEEGVKQVNLPSFRTLST